MRTAAALLLAAMLAGCASLGIFQTAVAPYSIEVVSDGGFGLWFNSQFVAVDKGFHGHAAAYGPRVYGGPIEKLWEWTAPEVASERKVWQFVLPLRDGEEIQVVESTWAAARAAIPSMPE